MSSGPRGNKRPVSALGHKQTYAVQQPMSALPPIATAEADIVKSLLEAPMWLLRGSLLADNLHGSVPIGILTFGHIAVQSPPYGELGLWCVSRQRSGLVTNVLMSLDRRCLMLSQQSGTLNFDIQRCFP